MLTHHVVPLERTAPRLRVTSLGVESPFADPRLGWCALRFVNDEVAAGEVGPPGNAIREADFGAQASPFHVALPPQLAGAAPRRISSYLAGRYCANRAMGSAGHPVPIPDVARGSSGGPIWPVGWTGSISHTDGTCVAVCGEKRVVSSLGVDCEQIVSLKVGTEIASIVAPEVSNGSAALGGLDLPVALTLAFSAKEALYKALFEQVGHFFGFEAAELVRISPNDRTLELQLVSDLTTRLRRGLRFTLRYTRTKDLVITALALDPSPRAG
jgi:enterobactin synthetase component D